MIDLKGILAISGYAGLFKVIAQAKSGVIVESISDKKRMNAFSHFKMSSLEDISIFTTGDDMPLSEVFQKISDKEKGKKWWPNMQLKELSLRKLATGRLWMICRRILQWFV